MSVTALILIVSIMGGFGKAIQSRLLSQEPHLVIRFQNSPFLNQNLKIKKLSKKNKSHNLNNTYLKKDTDKKIKNSLFFDKEEPAFLSFLNEKQKNGIKETIVFETQDLILKSKEGLKGVSAIGYSKQQWNKKILQLSSDFINPSIKSKPTPLIPLEDKEVILSHELALETGLSAGDDLILIPISGLLLPPSLLPPTKKLKVKGVLQNLVKGNVSSIYYQQGLIDFGNFSNINYEAEIKLHQAENFPIYEKLFSQYETQNWVERNSTLFFALKLEKFIMTLFLILSLLISCLGIASALVLLIIQKSKDIAILHAIGLSPKQIVSIFTKVGLYLSLIGLFSGAFIGICGTLFLKYNTINLLPEIYQDRTIPATFLLYEYLAILLGAFLISWISCYLPTKYLGQIKTTELLKITGF